MNSAKHSEAVKTRTNVKGRPQSSYPATWQEVEWTRQVTKFLNENTRRLFVHILICTLYRIRKVGDGEQVFIPVCQDFIKKYFPKAKWKKLAARGLIEVKSHLWKGGQSNEFSIPTRLLNIFFEMTEQMPVEEWRQAARFNLMTGERSRTKIKSIINDPNGHPLPTIYRDSVMLVESNRRVVNVKEMEKIVTWRKWVMKSLQLEYDQNQNDEVLKEKCDRATGQYWNDRLCLNAVVHDSQPILGMPSFRLYRPASKPANSGRAINISGAMQSCSKEMKEAGRMGVENFHNYDMQSSQVGILVEYMKIAGIDCEPFETYTSNKKAKHEYAARVGISVDCWKACFLGVVMGATVAKQVGKQVSRNRKPKNSITRNLLREFNYDIKKTAEALSRFREVIAPFSNQIDHWHEYLLNEYMPKTSMVSKRGEYITNRIGMRYYRRDMSKFRHKRKSQIAAFLLQGDESYYIHTLVVLSVKYNFRVVANEFDGICVIGEIPEEAIEEARQRTGMMTVKLNKKDFLDDWETKNQEIDAYLAVRESVEYNVLLKREEQERVA
jgi:hypothetical protein